jgi:hypothetical protein
MPGAAFLRLTSRLPPAVSAQHFLSPEIKFVLTPGKTRNIHPSNHPMSVTFLHTADWQLGKPYEYVEDPDKRILLQQERFHVIERMAALVSDHRAEFVVVAGDLFDTRKRLEYGLRRFFR